VAHARVKPDIQNVRLLAKRRALAVRTGRTGGHQILRLALEPDVGTELADESHHVIEDLFRVHDGVAILAVEEDDGHTPEPLARDAPVGPVLHHAVDPVAPPRGDPLDAVDALEGLSAQPVLLHGNEPLLGGAEDDGFPAAPAVRVGVLDVAHAEQRPHFLELLVDSPVGIEDELPREELHVLREVAVFVDGGVVVEAVLHADLVVLGSVARAMWTMPVPASRVTKGPG